MEEPVELYVVKCDREISQLAGPVKEGAIEGDDQGSGCGVY